MHSRDIPSENGRTFFLGGSQSSRKSLTLDRTKALQTHTIHHDLNKPLVLFVYMFLSFLLVLNAIGRHQIDLHTRILPNF